MSVSPSMPSWPKKWRWLTSTSAMTAHCSGSKVRTPPPCHWIRSAPWRTLVAHRGYSNPYPPPAGAGKTTSMRALVSAAHRRHGGTVLVLAPTGKAVDVAVREGAGDEGSTIAKGLQLLRDRKLELSPQNVVIVDEAAMVGTDDLRQLLSATTAAGTKTILVGDAHQLTPVKARGGMFAQLCADLPGTQHLSEVWRMRDPDERSASLALRNGGPASLRRAIGWYRTHDRLRCGDAITMAADVLGSTAPTPPLARMRCWCVTPPRWPTLLTSVYTTTPSAPRRQPSAGARAPHCRRRPHHQPPKRHVHPAAQRQRPCG